MTLDGLLVEVGPILNSSQFTHPSFREVLAARQLADEINSGSLSVSDAYADVWSCVPDNKPGNIPADFRIAAPSWRQHLVRLSSMLSDSKAGEFIQVVSENYFANQEEAYLFSEGSFADDVLEDLSICAKCIGMHPILHSQERVRKVLDSLLEVSREFYDNGWMHNAWERSDFAKKALSFTRSSYVISKLADYASGCKNIPDYGYYIDDARLSSGIEAYDTICKLVERGTKIDEDYLIERIMSDPVRKCDFNTELSLLRRFGSVTAFEKLADQLSNNIFDFYESERQAISNFFSALFGIVKRHDFEPGLIKSLNNRISQKSGELMANYHRVLSFFAQEFKEESDLDLYTHLEKKGMQFWDYWMVYKPK
jgi:hypothetical protein